MKCPTLTPTLVIADDARLAAQISSVLAQPNAYLPIIDGPRLTRPDRDAEVVRRNNAAGRVKPDRILLAGLSDKTCDAISSWFRPRLRSKIVRVSSIDDLRDLRLETRSFTESPLMWGRDRMGIGLLKALRAGTSIVFSDSPSPAENLPTRSDHLVVCEEGEQLSEVIAANYAFSLRAGLCLIPKVDDQFSEQILENFYNLYQEGAPTETLKGLKNLLRNLCRDIPIPPHGSLTFVTGRLPYGFGFTEVPSTHLFKYPDLGITVINGLAAEQKRTRGISVAVLVDPETTPAPEIKAAEQLLPDLLPLNAPNFG